MAEVAWNVIGRVAKEGDKSECQTSSVEGRMNEIKRITNIESKNIECRSKVFYLFDVSG